MLDDGDELQRVKSLKFARSLRRANNSQVVQSLQAFCRDYR